MRLGDLVRHAAAGEAGRDLTRVSPEAEDLVLEVDKRRLERVVANLVRNAEVHAGGCTGVRVERDAGHALILVDDAGPGIAEGQAQRIFDRFTRGQGTSSSGVGLGLAIVRRHVSLHGGDVTVVAGPDGGACFVVELPISHGR